MYSFHCRSWLDCFITAVVSVVICLLLFSSSLTLSVGFTAWCKLLTSGTMHRCEQGDYIKFTEVNIDTSNFYMEMMMAQFCTWIAWICWCVLSVLAIIKVYKYHKREAFTISMNRERERLLQRVGHRQPLIL